MATINRGIVFFMEKKHQRCVGGLWYRRGKTILRLYQSPGKTNVY